MGWKREVTDTDNSYSTSGVLSTNMHTVSLNYSRPVSLYFCDGSNILAVLKHTRLGRTVTTERVRQCFETGHYHATPACEQTIVRCADVMYSLT
jgi:hypothetical protein